MYQVRRALISVADKSGLEDLGKGLRELGATLVATGGTHEMLKYAGCEPLDVASITGFPEMLGGRVKTLHPKIHGGILARRNTPDERDLAEWEIEPIDLVVVNLYPFEQTAYQTGVIIPEAIEQIDIGGVALIRAAAKNFQDVAVVTHPERYPEVLERLRAGTLDRATRMRWATEAFAYTSYYDAAIWTWLLEQSGGGEWPARVGLGLRQVDALRYGENPHQTARLYSYPGNGTGVLSATQEGGKELSYNNLADIHAGLALVHEFTSAAVAIIKHNGPCGVAMASDGESALRKAYASDELSAYGGVICANFTVTSALAAAINDLPFIECIAAPRFDEEAIGIIATKKNRRILAVPTGPYTSDYAGLEVRGISGGALVQTVDDRAVTLNDLRHICGPVANDDVLAAMRFGDLVAKHVKSNAIVLVQSDGRTTFTVGIGGGQPSRVDAAIHALRKAGPERCKGAILASDAFLPKPDTATFAADAGVAWIVQPGGSKGDAETEAVCQERGIGLYYTALRHFRH